MVQHISDPGGAAVITGDPLDQVPALRPVTVDVSHAVELAANAGNMYNGWPVTYADIRSGLTFRRNIAKAIEEELRTDGKLVAVLLGASGVGKTSAARQVMAELSRSRFAWEHKLEQPFSAEKWYQVARILEKSGKEGVLFIDDAHQELPAICDLIEDLVQDNLHCLKLIATSSSNLWHLRVKVPAYHKNNRVFSLSSVDENEIDDLIHLVENNGPIRALVDEGFTGFTRYEKRRRLIQKCSADMFVCLKSIFSSDKLDVIILREYAALDPASQDIYRYVAALESAGVHVHRQLIMRLLKIRAMDVASALGKLEDIIHETTVSEREGVYAWHGRHKVIMDLIAKTKYFESRQRYELLEEVIDGLSPTYDIELRTIKDLCNLETGIRAVTDLSKQNDLLRKMISIAPSERVPRHRLLRNLVELNNFDRAEIEVQMFQHDFGLDGPATRYRIALATARAVRTAGLMKEDRIAMLERARELGAAGASRYDQNRGVLVAYAEVGIEIAKLTGNADVFNAAMARLRHAEDTAGDLNFSTAIARLSRRMANIAIEPLDLSVSLIDDE
jgi:hypothetical protein